MSSRARPKSRLSCDFCRIKKLKCDRQRPCAQCAKNPTRQCVYPSKTSLPASTLRVQDRVSVLEKRLETLINGIELERQDANTEQTGIKTIVSTPSLNSDGQQTRFIDSSHWEGVLHDIADIKQELETETPGSSSEDVHPSPSQADDSPHPWLLFGGNKDISHGELLHPLITRSLVDLLLEILVTRNRITGMLLVLHIPTFKQQLETYWVDQDNIDLAWLSCLYSVMGIASHIAFREGISIPDVAQLDRMSYTCVHRAAQCLRDSPYVQPSKHTVPAMILYMACEHAWSENGDFRATVVLAIVVRLAMRLGYHRDPKFYNNISVFDAEMQRRIWSYITQLDHLFARKTGMPRLIDDRKVDTALPRNLTDEDIYPEMTILPDSRPTTIPSVIVVLQQKTQMLAILGEIVDQASASMERTLELDKKLTRQAEQRPLWLLVPSEDRLSALSPLELNQVVESELILQSARMYMHRKFLISPHNDETYSYVRKSCIDAAERAIYMQYIMSKDWRGGVDEPGKNWRFISLVGHDFLTAAMLLCLDLKHTLTSEPEAVGNEQYQRKIRVLEQARDMWLTFGHRHTIARQASAILTILLRRFQPSHTLNTSPDGSSALQSHDLTTDMASSDPASVRPVPMLHDLPKLDDLADNSFNGSSYWDSAPFDDNDLLIQGMLDESQISIDWSRWGIGL